MGKYWRDIGVLVLGTGYAFAAEYNCSIAVFLVKKYKVRILRHQFENSLTPEELRGSCRQDNRAKQRGDDERGGGGVTERSVHPGAK
jgi:hypothetical protein